MVEFLSRHYYNAAHISVLINEARLNQYMKIYFEIPSMISYCACVRCEVDEQISLINEKTYIP